MRKLAIGGLVAIVVAVGSSAYAASENANQNACFGQARSEGAKTFHPMGQIISMRRGDNAEMNATFRENCQG